MLPYNVVFEEYNDYLRGWEASAYDITCAQESAEEACKAYFETDNDGEFPSYEAWKNA